MSQNTYSIVVESVWQTATALAYFRFMVTADRNFAIARGFNYNLPTIEYQKMQALGLVSWIDIRVITSTLIVTAPCWLALIAAGTFIHDILIYLSLSTLLNPFSFPSEATPEAEDSRDIFLFISKWVISKLDITLKVGTITLICFIFFKLPGVSKIEPYINNLTFYVIPGRPGSEYFSTVIEGGIIAIILMYFLKLTQIIIYGIGVSMLFAIAVCYVWFNFQWFTNEIFIPNGSSIFPLSKLVLYTILLSFCSDFVMAFATVTSARNN